MRKGTCKYCGREIELTQFGNHYKWVANGLGRRDWKCATDPAFPVRGHRPTRAFVGSMDK